MVFTTYTVGAAIAPTVIKTSIVHFVNRKPRRQKPTAQLSYDEGLNLIRKFLEHSSNHTVEELQAFTSQWVPVPQWVKADKVKIPEDALSKAKEAIIAQLGRKGIHHVGGASWWTWRRDGSALKAEWIEMRKDYQERTRSRQKGSKVMFYVHGGAYYFGSVDEHRYQLQRHARKLKARVFARILVILRDQGIPLPAGAVLISPWVDLTHSFPSVSHDTTLDYIPAHGFIHKPSPSWPPPNETEIILIDEQAIGRSVVKGLPKKKRKDAKGNAVRRFFVDQHPDDADAKANESNPAGLEGVSKRPGNTIPGPGHDLSIMINGALHRIIDQVQLYTPNQLLSHPLVSPVLQPSLGGLPPLLVLTGGGELLRDEQIYLAHKAAQPARYPPGEAYLDDDARKIVTKWRPTSVELQVWDDLCHVAPTLSFTRPAKYMYRTIAQFCARVLAEAQETTIDVEDDDEASIISTNSERSNNISSDSGTLPADHHTTQNELPNGRPASPQQVRKSRDSKGELPSSMIRKRVDRNGNAYPLEPPSALPALQMSANEIGVIKPGLFGRWLEAKGKCDTKYAREKRKVQKQRAKDVAEGYEDFEFDDVPPPSALAGRRGRKIPKAKKKGKSLGMGWWANWGSSHDRKTIIRSDTRRRAASMVSQKAHSPMMRPRTESASNNGPSANLGPSEFSHRPALQASTEKKLAINNEATVNKLSINRSSHSNTPPANIPLPESPPAVDDPQTPHATTIYRVPAIDTHFCSLPEIGLGESAKEDEMSLDGSVPCDVSTASEGASSNKKGKRPVRYAIKLREGDVNGTLEEDEDEEDGKVPDVEDDKELLPGAEEVKKRAARIVLKSV